MPKFSANLGFLWADLPLPDAIYEAATAGFEAVECHWPYEFQPSQIVKALDATAIPILSINTRPGNPGEFGLAALPDRKEEAQAAIREAVDYAEAISATNVHVMAGVAAGSEAAATFVENLKFATDCAKAKNITILIEAINHHDVPGYFLQTTQQASEIVSLIGKPNLKLLFDCYHVARMEGQVANRLKECMPFIGHIQFAGVPDRGPPDKGNLDYGPIFKLIDKLGYQLPLGAEYRPGDDTTASLGWMNKYQY